MPLRFTIHRYRLLPSTNSRLKSEAEAGIVSEGAVVTAAYQSQGRGRMGRSWEAPPGQALLCSILLVPELPSERLPLIGLLACLAVADALEDALGEFDLLESRSEWGIPLTGAVKFPPSSSVGMQTDGVGSRLQLKWPNDILHNDRKLCGILCESGTTPDGRRFVVVGIGLNLNQAAGEFPPNLRTPAASLFMITGKQYVADDLLKLILHRLDQLYSALKAENDDWVAESWLKRSGILNSRVRVHTNFGELLTGVCRGLDADGSLLLETDDGILHRIFSGETA